MAYTYDDFLNAANSSGLLSQISESDKNLAKQYPEFGLSMLSLTKDLNSATTAEQKLLATEAAEQLRSAYGSYGSGGSGSYYQNEIDSLLKQSANYGSFDYGRETEYQKALDSVTNPETFSYDLDGDIVWDSYRKQHLREGQRATEDTLAKVSAATGGRPSSYAVTAAQQAGDYYNAQLTDMIPTLYQNAYQRYLGDLETQQAALSALQTDRSTAYDEYLNGYNMLLTNLGNYQTQGDTLYSRYLNQLQMEQEAAQAQDAKELAAAQLLAEAGDYSRLAAIYGLSSSELATLMGASGGTTGSSGSTPGIAERVASAVKSGVNAVVNATGAGSGDGDGTAGTGGIDSVSKFKSSYMTLSQAKSRGITQKEWAAYIQQGLSSANLTYEEFEELEKYYGLSS